MDSFKRHLVEYQDAHTMLFMTLFATVMSVSFYHILRFHDEKWNYVYEVSAPNFTGTLGEFRLILVQEHNYYRRMRNLSDYEPTDILNELAEKYVSAFIEDPEKYFELIRSKDVKEGEGDFQALLLTPYMHPKLVAMHIYDERNMMDWKDWPHITINSSRNALHFTAMIWKGGKYIGSAFKASNTMRGGQGNLFVIVSILYRSPIGINKLGDFGKEIVPLSEEIAPYLTRDSFAVIN